jgi:hypothetical protein
MMSTTPDTGETVDRTRQADVNRLGADVRPGWFWRGFRARFPWLADVIDMARIGLGLGALLMLAACPDGNIAPDGRDRGWPIYVDTGDAPDWCAEICDGCVSVEGVTDCNQLRAKCACPLEG